MSRIALFRLLTLNLEGKIQPDRRDYMTPERAYAELRKLTGQDFGMDAAKWKEWLKANKKH
jgi:hypothetical protein